MISYNTHTHTHHARSQAGGIAVGVYTTNNAEACHFIADHCSANVFFAENKTQLAKILEVCVYCTAMYLIIIPVHRLYTELYNTNILWCAPIGLLVRTSTARIYYEGTSLLICLTQNDTCIGWSLHGIKVPCMMHYHYFPHHNQHSCHLEVPNCDSSLMCFVVDIACL